MPWHTAKSDQCPTSKPWAAVADATGEVMGCHATEVDAQAQVDALYANEPMMTSAPTPPPAAPLKTGRTRQARPNVNTALLEAGQLRAAALKEGRTPAGAEFRRQTVPGGVARAPNCPAQIRLATIQEDGKVFKEITGYASAYEQPYDMWDWAGPYKEVVSAGAGARSLSAKPDVQYLVNHGGVGLARTTTRPPSLYLSEDGQGLSFRALVNPLRDEVRNLVLAIEDGIITENSFAFMIDDGVWSDDFTEFRIQAYNINRGDVSSVNYGANPFTSIGREQNDPATTRETTSVPAKVRTETAAREIDERGRAITEIDAWLAVATTRR